jgi:SAM-dependent methyltransferase
MRHGESSSAYIPLPLGLENPRESARTTFDRLAATYDAVRPGYPPEAIDDLRSRCELTPASRVLEIGCGTGQATRDIAPSGSAIRCLEPGPELAAIARRNLAPFPNVELVVATFEAADEEPSSYDTLISATAFHWIDPSVGFTKAADLLCPHGTLALLTNMHASGGTQDALAEAMGALHRKLAPEVGSWTFPSVDAIRTKAQSGGDIAAVWSRIERKFTDAPAVGDLFDRPTVSVYPWVATYDSDCYVAMLSTQSSYALMDPQRRAELLAAVRELVESMLGGVVTKQYVTIVAVAERS